MAEDRGLCTHYRYHKQKIVFFLSSMRAHGKKFSSDSLIYWHLEEGENLSYEDKIRRTIEEKNISELAVYTIDDHFLRESITHLAENLGIDLFWFNSPKFLTPEEELESFFSRKRLLLNDFYIRQRKIQQILINDDQSPLGGQWNFDADNRQRLPKDISLPEYSDPLHNPHLESVKKMVDKEFPEHPGKLESFSWETTREGALKALKDFLERRFRKFGPYQDAIAKDAVFLFHSTLSPYLNNGLLLPDEVIREALKQYEQGDIPLSSCEGFIRQVLGWREFLRGMYDHRELRGNFFDNQRGLTKDWYEATTGIPPIDDAIRKADSHAYLHHIERLMIMSNFMLISGIHPDEVYAWFMELFIDSADWVMVPNVYGMGQFADGGTFATKPYISGANYVLKMSDYRKGEWCEIWDGLYWRFIEEHKEFFRKNHRLSIMVKALEKLDPDKKERIFKKAEDFIASKTTDLRMNPRK